MSEMLELVIGAVPEQIPAKVQVFSGEDFASEWTAWPAWIAWPAWVAWDAD